MSKMKDILDREYKKYVASIVGEKKAEKASEFHVFGHHQHACGAAKDLHEDYDLGIALTTEGLWLGYIAQNFGFPVLNVRLNRRGRGATWQPLDNLDEANLEDKRIIVFDNDALTGRTLSRTAKELGKFNPKVMDLLLVYERSPLTPNLYKNGKVPKGLPDPKEFYSNIDVLSWSPAKGGGLEITYDNGGYEKTFVVKKHSWMHMFDCRTNVPSGFGRVQTLEKDFQPDYKATKRFEAKIRGQVNE